MQNTTAQVTCNCTEIKKKISYREIYKKITEDKFRWTRQVCATEKKDVCGMWRRKGREQGRKRILVLRTTATRKQQL